MILKSSKVYLSQDLKEIWLQFD